MRNRHVGDCAQGGGRDLGLPGNTSCSWNAQWAILWAGHVRASFIEIQQEPGLSFILFRDRGMRHRSHCHWRSLTHGKNQLGSSPFCSRSAAHLEEANSVPQRAWVCREQAERAKAAPLNCPGRTFNRALIALLRLRPHTQGQASVHTAEQVQGAWSFSSERPLQGISK